MISQANRNYRFVGYFVHILPFGMFCGAPHMAMAHAYSAASQHFEKLRQRRGRLTGSLSSIGLEAHQALRYTLPFWALQS
jgi:hypothetical protein